MPLNLSRKEGERIYIGDRITVTVLEIRGNQVRLSIEAPPEVQVHREEVYQAIQAERRCRGK